MKPIHIFRPGSHTAMSGATLAFSEADLAAAAAAYDPALHEAPLVVGHPTADGPAYGWVQSLGAGPAGLHATPRQVSPEFAELVASGAYKKVSASFYTPTAPNNPVPGTYYLRHVGFLGAQPPAIKGLAPVEFAAADAPGDLVEFADWADQQNATLWRRMREFLIGQFGLDKADQAIPGWAVDGLQADAMQPETGDQAAATPAPLLYAEPGDAPMNKTAAELAAAEAALTAREAAVAARETAAAEFAERQAAAEAAQLAAEAAEFAEGLVQAGQLRPADKPRVVAILTGLTPSVQVMDFAEGSTTELVATPAREVFKALLAGMPKAVDFSERAPSRAALKVDTSSARAIQEAALQYQEAERKHGITVTYDLAVQHVCDQAGRGA